MVQPSPWRPSFDFWLVRSLLPLPCWKYPGVNARSAEGQSPYFLKIHAPFRRIPLNLLISSTKLGRATIGKNYR
jgi:hypothetical protein